LPPDTDIAEICEAESPFVNGEIELDESYFGARRVRGVRVRGAKGKIAVFGILKRGDKVYIQIVKNCSMSELMPIIKGISQ
jgi:transposase